MLASVLATVVLTAASTVGCDFATGAQGQGTAGSCASLYVARPLKPPAVNAGRALPLGAGGEVAADRAGRRQYDGGQHGS